MIYKQNTIQLNFLISIFNLIINFILHPLEIFSFFLFLFIINYFFLLKTLIQILLNIIHFNKLMPKKYMFFNLNLKIYNNNNKNFQYI